MTAHRISPRLQRLLTAMKQEMSGEEFEAILLHGWDGLLYMEKDEIDEYYEYYVDPYMVVPVDEQTPLHGDTPTPEDIENERYEEWWEQLQRECTEQPELPWEVPTSSESKGYTVADRRSCGGGNYVDHTLDIPRCPVNSPSED